eukprot:TRINITY_DN3756_c0_g1_i1.p1 TRINITY_DN3756_c0_g1~~TRINITY_DN3756_c0_g1_i1.p1  ORF type:complete len:240 (+),score=55.27 TRINITY_DN3756_c0_g1_i1:48-767(+)
MYRAIVLGSTGNVGGVVVKQLLNSPKCEHVHLVNRRSTDEYKDSPKVTEHVIDLDKDMAEAVPRIIQTSNDDSKAAPVHLGFSLMGIGKGSGFMSEEDIRRIEVTYPSTFAKACKDSGVSFFGLMTSAGADEKSSIKNLRIMAEKEKSVAVLQFPYCGIYRPAVISGNSNTPGMLEFFNPMLDFFAPTMYHSIHKDQLGAAIFKDVEDQWAKAQDSNNSSGEPRVFYAHYDEMQNILKS